VDLHYLVTPENVHHIASDRDFELPVVSAPGLFEGGMERTFVQRADPSLTFGGRGLCSAHCIVLLACGAAYPEGDRGP
jgi:hypothetical protein